MDRGFMEHYFDVTFNDAIGEIAGNDERYAELQSVADEAVHTFAKPLFWCRYSHRSCQHRSPQIYGEIPCAETLKKGAAYVSNQRIY